MVLKLVKSSVKLYHFHYNIFKKFPGRACPPTLESAHPVCPAAGLSTLTPPPPHFKTAHNRMKK